MQSTLISILGLAAAANAHMKMGTPVPWGPISNAPLAGDGSDFPCKNVAYDWSGSAQINVIQKGQSSPLTFIGSAVHGGGSCQLSLTTDLNPTKDSVWKVIKSYEGGCPAIGVAGNAGDNANAPGPSEYTFEIPNDVPAGNYTFSWSWMNKIGNREMYQNCAPVQAVGSGGSESFFNSLPDMFVANVGNGCQTKEGDDTAYPNPGSVVERLGLQTQSPSPIPDSLCPNAGYGSGSGSDSGSGSSSGNGSDTPAAPTPQPTLPGNVFITVPAATPTAQPEAPVQSQPATQPETPVEETPVETPVDGGNDTPVVDVPVNNGDAGSGSGSAFTAGTACNQDGYWNCVGGNSFQRCASGIWSATQQLAEGTTCSGGITQTIQISKRDGTPMRFGAKFIM